MTAKKNESVDEVKPATEAPATEALAMEAPATEAPATEANGGVRARRAFALKNLVPSIDWINKNVVSQGKGHRAIVGRVYGIVTGYVDKVNDINGVPTASIALNGSFEAESYESGEVSRFVTVFLPMAYAEQLKAAFLSDSNLITASIDLDIGLEATGKTIPYEWIVICLLYTSTLPTILRV